MRIVSLSILVAACATTPTTSPPKGGPRGLRASEHMQAAAQEARRAEHDSASDGSSMIGVGPAGGRDQPVAMPWYRSWDAGAEHAQLAAIHRSEAAQLEADYDDACRGPAGKHPTISPLGRFAVGGWPTANGVILYLSPTAGSPDLLMAMIKCHRAFMMLGWGLGDLGARLVDRMPEEHVAEHAAFRQLLVGTAEDIAARMDDLVDELDAYMAAEERTFLSAAVLRHDAITRGRREEPT